MTTPLAWLIDTNVVSEMMRPRVAAFLDSIAEFKIPERPRNASASVRGSMRNGPR